MSDCENLDPGAGARGGDDKANEEEQPKSKPLSVLLVQTECAKFRQTYVKD